MNWVHRFSDASGNAALRLKTVIQDKIGSYIYFGTNLRHVSLKSRWNQYPYGCGETSNTYRHIAQNFGIGSIKDLYL